MLFSFEESALISELEGRPTLQELSEKMRKDPSVISRDLKRISEKAPVIEKVNGRWVLTELGLQLSFWSKKISMEQSEILNRDYSLTIATTREFAARILAQNFNYFLNSGVRYKILTCDNGIEQALLDGSADFGFDCGRPQDPQIAFKQIIEEQIVTVVHKTNKVSKISDLKEEEFVHYSRLSPLQCKNIDTKKAKVSSNDISVVRNLVLNGQGWSTLPYYAVKTEVDQKLLKILPGGEIKGYKFGVWWPRGRESLLPKIKEAEAWLSRQSLISK